MIDLPPEANALLEKARRDHNPSAADAERLRRSLHAKLGIAAALAPAAIPTPAAASAAGSVTAKSGTLLFGLKASKVMLAVVALSAGASVPLIIGGDATPKPRASETCAPHCTSQTARYAAPSAIDPPAVSVTPTPTSEQLKRSERRTRRHERRQRASAQHEQAAREQGAADDRGEHDALRVQNANTVDARGAEAALVGGTTHERADGIDRGHGAHDASGHADAARGDLAPETAAAESTSTKVPAREAMTATAPSVTTVARAAIAASARGNVSEPSAPSAPPELTLIRSALTSLRDGAPQRALALLGEHDDAYPNGAFASERRGLRIVALCESGRLDEGRKERVVFLRREGSAPVAERVRHACQEAPGK